MGSSIHPKSEVPCPRPSAGCPLVLQQVCVFPRADSSRVDSRLDWCLLTGWELLPINPPFSVQGGLSTQTWFLNPTPQRPAGYTGVIQGRWVQWEGVVLFVRSSFFPPLAHTPPHPLDQPCISLQCPGGYHQGVATRAWAGCECQSSHRK